MNLNILRKDNIIYVSLIITTMYLNLIENLNILKIKVKNRKWRCWDVGGGSDWIVAEFTFDLCMFAIWGLFLVLQLGWFSTFHHTFLPFNTLKSLKKKKKVNCIFSFNYWVHFITPFASPLATTYAPLLLVKRIPKVPSMGSWVFSFLCREFTIPLLCV